MLNGFCLLSKSCVTPMFLTDNIKLDGVPFLLCISISKGTFIRYSHQYFSYLYFFVLHQLLHQQISLFTTFYNLIQHYLKKDFITNFSFLTDSLKPPLPPFPYSFKSQNLLSMTRLIMQLKHCIAKYSSSLLNNPCVQKMTHLKQQG